MDLIKSHGRNRIGKLMLSIDLMLSRAIYSSRTETVRELNYLSELV